TNHYGDLDGNANTKAGIAVFQTTGLGTWQYSVTGVTWIAINNVSQTQALLLPGSYSLRFTPASGFSGQANLNFVAWDGSKNKAGTTANISLAGATTAFSTNAGGLAITGPDWVGAGASLTSLLPGSYSTSDQVTPAGDSISSVFGNFFQ